jgi:transposase
MTWRHLNLFQHQAWLNARVPRLRCGKCGLSKVTLPWARAGSGFTLLFEARLMAMVAAMPVNALARQVGEHDSKPWRVLRHYVEQARAKTDASDVTRVGIDETAARRGHDCITLLVDIDQARVMFAIDISPAFIKGTAESLAKAAVSFDKFHAVKIINAAVDQVRRAEQKRQSLLRGTRYLWLRNLATLCDRQRARLESLPTRHLNTARAYQIRLALQELYDQPSAAAGASYLKKWYYWATHSRLEPVIEAARSVKRHWHAILRWFDSKIANGLIERINSLVQAAKAKARGYRSSRNLKAMVYLLAGKLDLNLPA